jgi:hypothetical protein
MPRTYSDSRQRERVQAGHRTREAERLERIRLQNAERQRRFQERRRAALAEQREADVYEVMP